MNILPAYSIMVKALLDDTRQPISSSVRKAAYDTIACALAHQCVEHGDGDMDDIAQMLCQSMSDQNRSVRLSAG